MTQYPSSSWQPPDPTSREQYLDLLADEALDELTAEETAELAGLRAVESGIDPLDLERAAAASHLALIENAAMSLPAETQQKLLKTAGKWMKHGGRRGQPMTLPAGSRVARAGDQGVPRRRIAGRIGWLAAAACLALAVWGWWPTIERTLWPTRAVNAADDRLVVAWKPGTDATGASSSGSINWSNTLQRGYLKVTGLKPNNPAVEQYQLWIGDNEQALPIDGGVFDVVDGQGEVIIQMAPKLAVKDPAMFAVTVEKPGGVVKSGLERISMLTELEKSGR